MQGRVTAILVAREGGPALDTVIEALATQSRPPDELVAVDAGAAADARAALDAAAPTAFVTVSRRPFGAAVDAALHQVRTEEWLWLLAHDTTPEPAALAALLGAVEVAPSVAVAGPKLMRDDAPGVIRAYGETLTTRGESVQLVEDELDQAQHDRRSDVLGVAAAGMLVRRPVWEELGGFDAGLPSIDASLDFCVRVRLAGHRVIGVPDARVRVPGGPELFDRPRARQGTRLRIARAARLHRRLVDAPAAALPFLWLALVPLALLRSIAFIVVGRPYLIGPEIGAAFATAFGGSVGRARRRTRRGRRIGPAALAPLKMHRAELRERTLRPGDRDTEDASPGARTPAFTRGGAWVVLGALALSLALFAPLLGAGAISGGALLPLSDLGPLWSHLLYGERPSGVGVSGAADPFTAVLAVLGTVTAWAPSAAVVAVTVLALPLAALGAWFCAARITTRASAAVLVAALWAVAPPLIEALVDGRLPAVLAHLALPWLVLAVVRGMRSWSAAGTAALLFALVAACAPVLVPAGVVAWLVLLAARPRAQLVLLPVPAAVLFLPLVFDQFLRGRPFALLADPGVPFVSDARVRVLDGWSDALRTFGADPSVGALVAALLALPLLLLALVAPFRRPVALAPLGLLVLGTATAAIAVHLHPTSVDGAPVPIWPGTAESLAWLGLVLAAAMAVPEFGRFAVLPAAVAGVTGLLVATPLVAGAFTGQLVRPTTAALLPAFVTAEAARDARIQTLVLRPTGPDSLAIELQRGDGDTLDEVSTLVTTRGTASADDVRLADLAGTLVRGGGRIAGTGISFVLLDGSGRTTASARDVQRAADALDATPDLVAVGRSDAGQLWRVGDRGAASAAPAPTAVAPLIAVVQAVVFLLALLLAIPFGSRHATRSDDADGALASTFDEDDDD